tara:strand:- start:134 stop:784 length:651 start_codon:yes stop_codon:yes gene_type:complete
VNKPNNIERTSMTDEEQIINKIRVVIDKPDGELTDEDLASVKTYHFDGKIRETIDGEPEDLPIGLENRGLKDLSFFKRLPNLEQVNFEMNEITSDQLENLSGCKKLNYLSLETNQITDLTPLSGLTRLQTLFLGNNKIIDLKPLVGLSNLESLGLNDNIIADLTPLHELKDFEGEIYLDGNPHLTESQLKDLQKAVPGAYIEHEFIEYEEEEEVDE